MKDMDEYKPFEENETEAFEETDGENGEKDNVIKTELLSWLQVIAVCCVVLVMFAAFIGRPVMVVGSSMLPNLENGDRLIAFNVYGELSRGDVVVIKEQSEGPLVKRVIGLPGETVDIDYKNNAVLINGEPIEEDYIDLVMEEPLYNQTALPLTLDEDCYFVLGDNRNHSSDSRYIGVGVINKSDIFGRVGLRFMPFEKFGFVE